MERSSTSYLPAYLPAYLVAYWPLPAHPPMRVPARAQVLRALSPLITPEAALLGLRMADRHITYAKYCAFWVSVVLCRALPSGNKRGCACALGSCTCACLGVAKIAQIALVCCPLLPHAAAAAAAAAYSCLLLLLPLLQHSSRTSQPSQCACSLPLGS